MSLVGAGAGAGVGKRARARTAGQKRAKSNIALTVASIVMLSLIVVFGVLAAMPIYETVALWIVAGVGALLAGAIVWLGRRLKWGALTLAALTGGFVLVVVPLAVPGALGSGPMGLLRGLGDGLAAVAVG